MRERGSTDRRAWHPSEMLIRATVLPGAEGIRAWEHWLGAIRPSDVDAESARLFPLLYRNLADAGVDEHRIAQYRQSWQRSRFAMKILHDEAAGVARLMGEHSIAAVFLKGFALAHLYYGDPGLRPMADFDLLVPRELALQASHELEAAGWLPDAPITADTLEVSHGAELVHGGARCDLHWSMMWEVGEGLDEEIRARALRLRTEGGDLWFPDHSDQLMHVLVHGTRIGEGRMLRWIPDAHFVVTRSGPDLDWDRFTNMVVDHGLSWPVRDALLYLRVIAGTAIPEEVIAAVPARVATSMEKRVHAIGIEKAGAAGALTYLPTLISRFRRMSHGGIRGRLRWIAAAFEQAWGVPRRRIPIEMLRRAGRRIVRMFSHSLH